MKIDEVVKTLDPPSISVGDEVKVGKFKNRKAEVKGFKKDDNGQPVLKTTKGDQKLFKPRVTKLEPVKEEKKKGFSCRCGKIHCKGECAPKPDYSCRCGKISCRGECADIKENYGWKGEYDESYAMLLDEMSIIVSQVADQGGNLDDAISTAMEEFDSVIMDMGIDPLKIESDLTLERHEDFI